jgi:cell division protein FtsI (penicillin-binding protein 3)
MTRPPQWDRAPVRQPAPGARRRRSRPDGRRRLKGIAIFMGIVLTLFGARLIQIQGLDATAYAASAEQARLKTVALPATRGALTDSDGVPFATTIEARNVTADQTLVIDPKAAAEKLAPVLGMSESSLRERLTGDRRFIYIAKTVTPGLWAKVRALKVPGIFSERATQRVYPGGVLAANVVGFVGADGRGLGGMELALDQQLAGRDGSATYETGAGGRQIPTGTDDVNVAIAGRDVQLTIDRDIQWVAQQAIAQKVAEAKAESGTVVVMDPRTGKVLALATAPSFDPGDPTASAAKNRGNRAVTEIYEPGSTSKVMTAAAVIEEGHANPSTKFTVPGGLLRGPKVFRDHNPHGTLRLTLNGIMAQSSNIGTILAAEKLQPETLYGYLKKFGIAEPTGLEFPGESRGLLAEPSQWSVTSFPTIAFGQGLSLNAVQATSVFATLANNGVRMQPRLVDAYVDGDGVRTEPTTQAPVRVVSPRTASKVRQMLESVVSDRGTAPMAGVPGYRVAGKTGTAQRVDPTCGCYRGYTASFIGMAPADKPALVVSVTLQDPKKGHYGGMLGGPVFKRVMSFALQDQRIPPTGRAAPRIPVSW